MIPEKLLYEAEKARYLAEVYVKLQDERRATAKFLDYCRLYTQYQDAISEPLHAGASECH